MNKSDTHTTTSYYRGFTLVRDPKGPSGQKVSVIAPYTKQTLTRRASFTAAMATVDKLMRED